MDRVSAGQAAEHPWLDPNSTILKRRRAVRAEVAAVTAERAANAVVRLKALVGQPSTGLANVVTMRSVAAAQATAATVATLSEIAQLVTTMLVEVEGARKEVKRMDKTAAEPENIKAACEEGGVELGVSGAVLKAEEAVRRAEGFAKQAESGSAAAADAVDAWGKVIAQESTRRRRPRRPRL